MTEDQLQAMENSAPMLVAEVRTLQARLEDYKREVERRDELLHGADVDLAEANKKLRTIHEALSLLMNTAIGAAPRSGGA